MDSSDDELCPELVTVPEPMEIVDTTSKTDIAEDARVPVTIISGFLGAGKTTLLNYILKEKHGLRIAVILNDVSEDDEVSNIEQSQATASDGSNLYSDWVELQNGCLCCRAADGGLIALEGLMKRKGTFDYVLLETAGLANPAPIARMFWADEGLGSQVMIDAVVTVVDASNFEKQLDDSGTQTIAQDQAAFADVLLLNKADLCTKEQLSHLQGRLHAINATAPLHTTTRSSIDLSKILDVRAFEAFEQSEPQDSHQHHGTDCDGCDNATDHDHGHDPSIGTVSVIVRDTPLNWDAFDEFLRNLLWAENTKYEILRCKGVINCTGYDKRVVVQGLYEVYDSVETTAWGSDERVTRFFVVGRRLGEANIEEGVRACAEGVAQSEAAMKRASIQD